MAASRLQMAASAWPNPRPEAPMSLAPDRESPHIRWNHSKQRSKKIHSGHAGSGLQRLGTMMRMYDANNELTSTVMHHWDVKNQQGTRASLRAALATLRAERSAAVGTAVSLEAKLADARRAADAERAAVVELRAALSAAEVSAVMQSVPGQRQQMWRQLACVAAHQHVTRLACEAAVAQTC